MSTCAEKVKELRGLIESALAGRIGRDSRYWLLDVPYHSNVGDTLIWQGEIDFLRQFGGQCAGMFSLHSLYLPPIPAHSLVLLHGGGNLGDLWTKPVNYRKAVMANNPTCRFLIFPQTVYYQSQENLKRDADFFAQFDCTICARSQASYDLLRANFKNEVLLVPDMAFCIDMGKWHSEAAQSGRPLLLLRQDAEQRSSPALEALPREGLDVDDWWPMCHANREFRLGRRLRKRLPHACCFNLTQWICDAWHASVYRPFLIRKGIEQFEAHTDIYTTRLHGCILSLLLGKEKIVLFDNSYGKNRDFYETWLRDCAAVEFRA